MFEARMIRAVLLPAAVFQSVIFGGAYGTGREIVEFVSRHGPRGGLFACLMIALGFALVLIASFEFARRARTYDYRSFFRALIGRFWLVFEILFVITIIIVFAVNGSAAGRIIGEQFSIPEIYGATVLFFVVVVLNYSGRRMLERTMSICVVGLMLVLAVFCIDVISQKSETIAESLSAAPASTGWAFSGLQYILYNVAAIPVLLFCARGIRTIGESVAAGTIAAVAAVFPALLFHLAFLSDYPAILAEPLPVYVLMSQVAVPGLFVVYIVVLFAMIVQTVAGLLQGLNERLDNWMRELGRDTPGPIVHALVAVATLLISAVLTKAGIVALVARGYGNLAWGYLLVFVIPLLTIGIFKMCRRDLGGLQANINERD